MATAAGGVTVKVAVQVLGASQSLVTVKVADATPPQDEGADGLLLLIELLQPPENDAVFFQVANLVSMADCV